MSAGLTFLTVLNILFSISSASWNSLSTSSNSRLPKPMSQSLHICQITYIIQDGRRYLFITHMMCVTGVSDIGAKICFAISNLQTLNLHRNNIYLCYSEL